MKLQPFSQNITRMRKARGLSLPDLADKARIPKSVLWKIETSPTANPKIGTLCKISRALGLDISNLIR